MNTSMAKQALTLASAEDAQVFEEALSALLLGGHDVQALLEWGDHYVLRAITCAGKGKGCFEVLRKRDLLTDRAVLLCLSSLAHDGQYESFLEIYKSFFPEGPVDGGDKVALAVCMAYFNEHHSYADIERRIKLMTTLGLLNLADTYSAVTEAMLSSCMQQMLARKDIRFMKVLVEQGYPADSRGSVVLRGVPFASGSVEDAEFFISAGASVEARGYLTIYHALVNDHLLLARYLFEVAATTEDRATIKAMIAFYGEQYDDKIDVDLLDAPAASDSAAVHEARRDEDTAKNLTLARAELLSYKGEGSGGLAQAFAESRSLGICMTAASRDALAEQSASVDRGASLGFRYIAKRPCGRVSAAGWDDLDRRDEAEKSAEEWRKRGDTVERVERFEHDPEPEWMDHACRQCDGKCKARGRIDG